MNVPAVHIVILNWNGLKDTLECLASIRKLTYPQIRVQVVDNASENGEAEVIEREFPEVNVLKQQENIGFCGGCNIGMKQAITENADFVMLLNNDTLLPPNFIEALIEEYRKLANVGAVSPIILKYPETEKVWFSIAKWETRWENAEAEFRLSYGENYEEIKSKQPYKTEFACGCCLLVSTKVIKEVGMFDERYFAFYDEAEWCARMRKRGLKSYIVPSSFIYHKVGGSTPSLVMVYLLTRNRLLWVAENLSLAEKLRAYPCLLKELIWHLFNLGNLIPEKKRYYAKERSRAVIQGWKDYCRGRFGKWNGDTERVIFNKS